MQSLEDFCEVAAITECHEKPGKLDDTATLVADLVKKSHAIAVEKGWWPDGKRSPIEQVNNFHAEVSEAWEEYRKTGTKRLGAGIAYWGEGHKPEGFWVEIADLLIRLADSAGHYGWKIEPFKSAAIQIWPDPSHAPEFIGALHSHLCLCASAVGQNGEFVQGKVSAIFGLCLWFAGVCDVDLWQVIEVKMDFNRTRPPRHGGKHA